MTSRPVLRALLPSALITAATVLVPAPASASPLLPRMRVYISGELGNWLTICGEGDVNDGATTTSRWVFTVTGGVSDRSPIGPYVLVEDGDSFLYCDSWYVGSPPDAALTATLSFAGLGTNSDIAGTAFLVYEWNSVLGAPNTFSFGLND